MYYYIRYKIYHDVIYVCNYLKNNIVFNKNSISDILSSAYLGVGFISKIYLQSENKQKYRLFSSRDIEIFNKFFDSLGLGDIDYEISNLDYYLEIFKAREIEEKERLGSNGLAYAKLFFCLGIIIIILLL